MGCLQTRVPYAVTLPGPFIIVNEFQSLLPVSHTQLCAQGANRTQCLCFVKRSVVFLGLPWKLSLMNPMQGAGSMGRLFFLDLENVKLLILISVNRMSAFTMFSWQLMCT